MKRVDIKVGFSCNNHCKFCVQGNKRDILKDKTTGEIKSILKACLREGIEGVVFTGGEPMLREDILELVKFAKSSGFVSIQIQTNGRMFAYEEVCRSMIKAGVNEFGPSLHGNTASLHDSLTCAKGSFAQTTKGIRNLRALGQRVMTNTVITQSNFKKIPGIARLLVSLDVSQFQFAFIHISGTAKLNTRKIVARKKDVMPYVYKGLEIGLKAGKMVMTEAIPYCLMKGYEKYIAERIIPSTKVIDHDSVIENYTDHRMNEGKAKGPGCRKCRYFASCEGPWKEYPELFGWEEFKPVL